MGLFKGARAKNELRQDESTIYVRFKRSYMARLIMASDDCKQLYNLIKNTLLSHAGVVYSTSWDYELFSYLGEGVLQMDVLDDVLYVYYPLEIHGIKIPETRQSRKDDGTLFDTPYVVVPIQSSLQAKNFLKIVNKICKACKTKKMDIYRPSNFCYPFENIDSLIEKGLIIPIDENE